MDLVGYQQEDKYISIAKHSSLLHQLFNLAASKNYNIETCSQDNYYYLGALHQRLALNILYYILRNTLHNFDRKTIVRGFVNARPDCPFPSPLIICSYIFHNYHPYLMFSCTYLDLVGCKKE
jgi:hypothetical protein